MLDNKKGTVFKFLVSLSGLLLLITQPEARHDLA